MNLNFSFHNSAIHTLRKALLSLPKQFIASEGQNQVVEDSKLLLSDVSRANTGQRVFTDESSSSASSMPDSSGLDWDVIRWVQHLVLTPLKLELATELRLDRPLSLVELVSTG